MQFGLVVRHNQVFRALTRALEISGVGIGECEIVCVFVIAGLDFVSFLEVRNCFDCLPVFDQHLAQTMIRVETGRFARHIFSPRFFFRRISARRSRRGLAECDRLFGKFFTSSDDCIGTVPSEICGVHHAGNGKLRLVIKLRLHVSG